ncbi:two-component regulator propeller domain-containing protein [Larkinella terrae]|uniref:Signal transduction histidine kinase internal region domain-containing protein n=1 Tax=Larkinella terrae TaxID=2025311 RepID=A0A7K0ERD6_9BACT|nr:two-component regulator propeller domain-containing protein [Larkinella terrae]MRS64339.1 hypothetical protein [Larkinella terrae]
MAGKISVHVRLVVWLVIGLAGLARSKAARNQPVQFEFRHIQEKDGLSINFTTCFLQDRDGFLWVGTFDGLNRYDGVRFHAFKHQRNDPQSLLNNTIHDLCEDHQGNIWIALDNGLSCYNKATGRFRNITSVDGHKLGFTSNVLTDRRGDVWFTSTGVGLHRYNTRTGQMEYFPFHKGDNPRTALREIAKNGLLEDPHRHGFWLAHWRGLSYFDADQQEFISQANNPGHLPIFTDHSVSALALDGERLIFSDNTARQIVVFSLAQRRILKTIAPTSHQKKRDVFDMATIFVDRQHNLWTSSWNYLLFHISADYEQVTELEHDEDRPTSIAGGFFWAGWQHPDGSVWLGTVNGISLTNPERAFYNVYNIGTLFPALNDERGIHCIVEDDDGSWWLGTSIRGLLHYFPQTNRLEIYRLPNASAERPYGRVISSIARSGETLYLAGETGLFTFDTKTRRFSDLPLPPSIRRQNVRVWNILKEGETLWVTGESKEAYRYHFLNRQWETFSITPPPGRDQFMLSYIFKDRHNTIWVDVYPAGIARFSPQLNTFELDEHTRDHPYEKSVSDITEDSAGNFWMSTNGFGLLRYNPRTHRYTNWTENEGLAYDHCLAVLPDAFGNIWVGAYNKFSVFSPRTNRFVNFTLPYSSSNQEYLNKLFPLRNGHILGALKGYLVEFSPEKLVKQPPYLPSQLLISQVTVGDSLYLNHQDLTQVNLKADETGFTVHFGALLSDSHTPFDYFYQLEGYEDWKPAGELRYAVYNRMPGGNYLFRIKGVAPDGRETPVKTLPIHLATLFYQTAGFWVSIAVALLGLAIGFLRYRARQIEKVHTLHMQASRLARDKTEIQYQNLINHLNPHFLFNSLTSLNSLIILNPREASAFLRKLSIIYRYILQNKDKELVSLADELSFVQHYIDLQRARFKEGLNIAIEVDPDNLSRQIVPVTIQNLLENAIKHNIIDKASPLVIRIYTREHTLWIENSLQRKEFVETSHKQGLASLKSLYQYLSQRDLTISETATHFIVGVPLL